MIRSVLADTGPLYAAVDSDDVHHTRAQHELEQLADDNRRVMIVYSTLLEAQSLILRRLGRQKASVWLEEILRTSALTNPSAEDYLNATIKLGGIPDQSLTLFDATLAAVGKRLDAEIWTYDYHFDVMGARVWRSAPA